MDALEHTSWPGVVGTVKFYDKDHDHTHGMEYGPDAVSGLFVQWQGDKQVPVWPKSAAGGNELVFPSFIKLTN